MMQINEKVFEQFPTIKTERLLLREIRENDLQEVFKIYSNSKVINEYYGLYHFTKIEQVKALMELWSLEYEQRQGIRWAIEYEQQIIGICHLKDFTLKHFRCLIAYELSSEYWGQGIMHEAVEAVLYCAFNLIGLNRIEAHLHPINDNSIRLCERLNFNFETILEDNYYFDGAIYNTTLYIMLAKNFQLRQEGKVEFI